jgi:hypothetical protein
MIATLKKWANTAAKCPKTLLRRLYATEEAGRLARECDPSPIQSDAENLPAEISVNVVLTHNTALQGVRFKFEEGSSPRTTTYSKNTLT